jgi:hypothetical protein
VTGVNSKHSRWRSVVSVSGTTSIHINIHFKNKKIMANIKSMEMAETIAACDKVSTRERSANV